MGISEQKIKKLARVFRKYRVVFAYLFGSRAIGKAVKSSDYDIAIAFSEKTDSAKMFDIRCKIVSELAKILQDENVEVVALNDIKSILFKFVIIKEGILLFESDHGARVIFELKTVNEYYDFAPFIEKYNTAYMERELAKINKR